MPKLFQSLFVVLNPPLCLVRAVCTYLSGAGRAAEGPQENIGRSAARGTADQAGADPIAPPQLVDPRTRNQRVGSHEPSERRIVRTQAAGQGALPEVAARATSSWRHRQSAQFRPRGRVRPDYEWSVLLGVQVYGILD